MTRNNAMIKIFWASLVISFALSALVLSALPSLGHNRHPDDVPKPQPRPLMDCWINHDTGGVDCRFVRT